jgi:4-amino-4-deoxy-L-arabinose transferase-like glycosyltransferase
VILGGTSLTVFRLSSLALVAVGLVATYELARIVGGRAIARLTLFLVMTHVWLFIGARTFRPEAAVFAFVMCYAWWMARAVRDGWPFTWLAGVAAGAAMLSQQTGILFLLAFTVGLTIWAGPRLWRVLPRMWPTLVPILGVYAMYVVKNDPGVNAWEQLTGEGRGFQWAAARVVAKETERWSNFLGGLSGVPWMAAVAAGSWIAWRRRMPSGTVGLAVLVSGLLLMAAVVPVSTGRYLLPLVPAMAMIVAAAALALWTPHDAGRVRGFDEVTRAVPHPWGGARRIAVGLAVGAVVSTSLAQIGVLAFSHKAASYRQISARLASAVGDAPSVAAPISFYLTFRDRTFVPTNVSPDYRYCSPVHARWLSAKIAERRVEVVLDANTDLQSTQGIGPRPASFENSKLSDLIEVILTDDWYVAETITSRDFGAIRVWRRVDARRPASRLSARRHGDVS